MFARLSVHVVDTLCVLVHLAAVDRSCSLVQLADILLVRAVEYRCCDLPAERLCNVSKVNLEHLSDVHSGRYAQRIQHDVKRSTVRKERHILLAENSGNDTLVTVTARHLIADGDLSLLRDIYANLLVYSGGELIAVVAVEYLYVNNDTAYAVGNSQRVVAHFPCLLAEDRAEQSFLRVKFSFALGRNLTYQDIAGVYLSANTNDTALIKVLESLVGKIRDITGDLLGAELGFTALEFVFLYMN